jgi:hypothetical protein
VYTFYIITVRAYLYKTQRNSEINKKEKNARLTLESFRSIGLHFSNWLHERERKRREEAVSRDSFAEKSFSFKKIGKKNKNVWRCWNFMFERSGDFSSPRDHPP